MARGGFISWERRNFYASVIGILVALVAVYVSAGVSEHYWPWAVHQVSEDGAASLPPGYSGTWAGDIDMPVAVKGLGSSAAIVMTLWSGDGMGQDVGSLSVAGPSVAGVKTDCTAQLHWQSGDGPVNLTYDSGHATGICWFIAKIANATITLVQSGELNYQIDMSGISSSAAELHPS